MKDFTGMPIIENPGIAGDTFEIVLNRDCYYEGEIFNYPAWQKLEILSKPIRNSLFKEILYYLTLGLYDKRGWTYKVKLVK